MNPTLAYFFSGCKNPENVSEVVTMLAAGVPLPVDRLPLETLPAVALLATIGLRKYGQQIVDDYCILVDRLSEAMKDTSVWNDGFWHPQMFLVACVVDGGPRGKYDWSEVREVQYMYAVYGHLVNNEVERMFENA